MDAPRELQNRDLDAPKRSIKLLSWKASARSKQIRHTKGEHTVYRATSKIFARMCWRLSGRAASLCMDRPSQYPASKLACWVRGTSVLASPTTLAIAARCHVVAKLKTAFVATNSFLVHSNNCPSTGVTLLAESSMLMSVLRTASRRLTVCSRILLSHLARSLPQAVDSSPRGDQSGKTKRELINECSRLVHHTAWAAKKPVSGYHIT